MAVAPLAAPLAIGSLGLSAAGELVKGQGLAAGYAHAEDKAQRQALAARTAADETDAQLREELAATLGNIMAIRAAANTDPTSPTGQAILEEERRVSDRQRRIKTDSLRAQASQYDADAAYYSYAGENALGLSALNAFAKLLPGAGFLGGGGAGGFSAGNVGGTGLPGYGGLY